MINALIISVISARLLIFAAGKVYKVCNRLVFPLALRLFAFFRTLRPAPIRIIGTRFLGPKNQVRKLFTKAFLFCTLITSHAKRIAKTVAPYNQLILRIALISLIYQNIHWEEYKMVYALEYKKEFYDHDESDRVDLYIEANYGKHDEINFEFIQVIPLDKHGRQTANDFTLDTETFVKEFSYLIPTIQQDMAKIDGDEDPYDKYGLNKGQFQ